jgi:recombinational DNA repair protein (RecF pathway)
MANKKAEEFLVCSRCHEKLSACMFFRNKSKKTLHDCYCKECRRKVDREYYANLYTDPERHAKRKASYTKYREKVKQKANTNGSNTNDVKTDTTAS